MGRPVSVPPIDEMDDDDFLKHLDKRHWEQTQVETALHESKHIQQAWVGPYRAFHEYVHRTQEIDDHIHEEEEW
jgi:hypothetical protein